jgi:Lipoxygenase
MSEPDRVHHLPLSSLGFPNTPAVPYWPDLSGIGRILKTLLLLALRALETEPAKLGLSVSYTIDGQTHPAHDFLYGGGPALTEAIKTLERKLAADPNTFLRSLADGTALHAAQSAAPTTPSPLTRLPLDHPEQFALSWTTYEDVYGSSKALIPTLASWLVDGDAATEHFWPTIATFGLAYNLLILEKVGAEQRDDLAHAFGDAWGSENADTLLAEGRLYAIDLSIFDALEHQSVDQETRFTPGTITLLQQDPQSKALTPIAIRVAGDGGGSAARIYRSSDPAWLYALQAAKTSITVYGVWLGHVYHWHIVTAAMQMAMYNTLPAGHRLEPLLLPQSDYLIEFDDVLLLLWPFIAPPTSITGPLQFLSLIDRFAAGRTFFDDDPTTTVERLGLDKADFRVEKDWDVYPIVGFLFDLWSATEEYVQAVIDQLYADDDAVAQDTALQAWIAACGDPNEGNVRGLPTVQTRSALIGVLTSLLYRVTAHGVSRLNPSANPILTFVADFPPCLQDATLPDPQEPVTTEDLLARLPHTGTIGMVTTFYFTFVFSVPYVPFIPYEGVDADLYFPGGADAPCNQALIKYRQAVLAFIDAYVAAWQQALSALQPSPLSEIPPYASSLTHQWPRNIET